MENQLISGKQELSFRGTRNVILEFINRDSSQAQNDKSC